jgi:hypothetical protein
MYNIIYSMEAVVPIIALTWLYNISRQNRQETFTNQTVENKHPEFPVTYKNPHIKNIPKVDSGHYQYKEDDPGVKHLFQKKQPVSDSKIKTLAGEEINSSMFTHNNQQPFFGSSVKQSSSTYGRSENVLDTMNGSATYHNKKQEIAPLFAPSKDLKWNNGTPNNTELMKSRMHVSNLRNNEKTFESKQIAPGFKGIDNNGGELGFNLGLVGREQWMPKTIDDLNVNTKQTYEGRILNGKNIVSNRCIQGETEKNRPDTYFINTPERYFTTTGVEQAPKARSKEVLKAENRIFTTAENYGGPKYYNKPYAKGTYESPQRPTLDAPVKHISNPYSARQDKANHSDIENYRASQKSNPRNTSFYDSLDYSKISSIVKATISPIIDTLRPTKKYNTIGNSRGPGNAGTSVPTGTVFNPADRTRTTIREMTEHGTGHQFVGNQSILKNRVESGYITNENIPVLQQRDTTNTSHIGNMGNTHSTSNPLIYDTAYNANLIDKSTISLGRNPTNSNVKLYTAHENMNVSINKSDKKEQEIIGGNPSVSSSYTPIKDNMGVMSVKNTQLDNKHNQRFNPELLDAFRKNPYTQSLHTF